MSNNRYAIQRVVQAFLEKSCSETKLGQEDAKDLNYGKGVITRIKENAKLNKNNVLGFLTNDELNKALGYLILRRENPILEPGNHINFEGAVAIKDGDFFPNRKEQEEEFVNQINRAPGLLDCQLKFEKGKAKVEEAKK